MGYYVGVNFSFSVNSLRRLKEVANKTLSEEYDYAWSEEQKKTPDETTRDDFKDSYTYMMLEQIADYTDKYIHPGNKGDMFIWGGVWNYYSPDREIQFLKKFLKNCWNYYDNQENILFDFDKALLIVNREQSELSEIYEFSFDSKEIVVRKSESELNWNQM